MIDTDKYEGHTPIGFWHVVGQGEAEDTGKDSQHIPYWMYFNKVTQGDSRADWNLMQDAPLLLAEVKRLRKVNDELQYDLESFQEVAAEDEAALEDLVASSEGIEKELKAEVKRLREGIEEMAEYMVAYHEVFPRIKDMAKELNELIE